MVTKSPEEIPGSALVLVENEVTYDGDYDFWADGTGVQYHFPNHYKNRVKPGLPFVYYKGVRRSGGKRGKAEYFGVGVIGDVWADPNQSAETPAGKRRWYCAIEGYEPFEMAVAAKRDGKFYEDIHTSLGWRTGVRKITLSTLEELVRVGMGIGPGSLGQPPEPALANVELVDPSELLVGRPRSAIAVERSNAVRRSERAKQIGDWGEKLIVNWLRSNLPKEQSESIRWVADHGETPGWDISYRGDDGEAKMIEVKATTLARFSSFELTAKEWKLATLKASNYAIAFVTRALTEHQRIGFLWNPAAEVQSGSYLVEPAAYKVVKVQDP